MSARQVEQFLSIPVPVYQEPKETLFKLTTAKALLHSLSQFDLRNSTQSTKMLNGFDGEVILGLQGLFPTIHDGNPDPVFIGEPTTALELTGVKRMEPLAAMEMNTALEANMTATKLIAGIRILDATVMFNGQPTQYGYLQLFQENDKGDVDVLVFHRLGTGFAIEQFIKRPALGKEFLHATRRGMKEFKADGTLPDDAFFLKQLAAYPDFSKHTVEAVLQALQQVL